MRTLGTGGDLKTHLKVDSLSATLLDLVDGFFGVSLEDLKVCYAVLCEEWTCHRAMELPHGSIRVEDSITYAGIDYR